MVVVRAPPLAGLVLAGQLLLGGTGCCSAAPAGANNPNRTFMAWMLADPDATAPAWAARLANIKVGDLTC